MPNPLPRKRRLESDVRFCDSRALAPRSFDNSTMASDRESETQARPRFWFCLIPEPSVVLDYCVGNRPHPQIGKAFAVSL